MKRGSIGRLFSSILVPIFALCGCSGLSSPTEYPMTQGSAPYGVVCSLFGGTIWVSEPGVGRIVEQTKDGRFVEFTLPRRGDPTGLALSLGEGFVWFTEPRANKVGRVDSDGKLKEFTLPHDGSEPLEITIDPSSEGPNEGAWFTERAGNRIGHITFDGRISELSIPTRKSQPTGITQGPQSGVVWFTEFAGNKIGAIDKDGRVVEYSIPTPRAKPGEIAYGGNYNDIQAWFVETAAGKIGLIKSNGKISEVTADGNPSAIVVGPLSQPWYVDAKTSTIGYTNDMGSGGTIRLDISSPPSEIAFCPGPRTIWVTEPTADKIARFWVTFPNW